MTELEHSIVNLTFKLTSRIIETTKLAESETKHGILIGFERAFCLLQNEYQILQTIQEQKSTVTE